MRKDTLVDLVTHYGNDLPILLQKIQNEINAANIAGKTVLANKLTKLKTDISDLGIQYARDKIEQINDSPEIDTAIGELRKIKKDIDKIIAGTKKASAALGVFTAALGLLKTVGDKLTAA
jgi:hypothetical protein